MSDAANVTRRPTPDVFGGGLRQIESLESRQESQRFQLEATYLTLTTISSWPPSRASPTPRGPDA